MGPAQAFYFFNLLISLQIFWGSEAFAQVADLNKGPDHYTAKKTETDPNVVPDTLKGVTIKENLGQNIDLNLIVTDDKGQTRTLGSFFNSQNNPSKKPILLSPIYFNCPGLCNFHFNGVVDALKKIDWNPGDKYDVVAFSFDAKENSELAAKKKASYLDLFGRANIDNGFHFLTADQNTITKLTDSLGFEFRWNEAAQEWSHASAAIIITPDGKISRYLHGIEFDPKDVKLALNEATSGRIGNIIDHAILFCFKYDEQKSKYGLQVFRVVQLGGLLTVFLLLIWLTPVVFKSGREKLEP